MLGQAHRFMAVTQFVIWVSSKDQASSSSATVESGIEEAAW